MKKRKVTRYNKEKIAMIASSLLIVSACAITGVYIHGKEKDAAEEQIVDFAALEDKKEEQGNGMEVAANDPVDNKNQNLEILDQDLDADPFYQETNSSSIINPTISANTTAGAEEGTESKEGKEIRLSAEEKDGEQEKDNVKESDLEDNEAAGEEDKEASEETMASGAAFSEQSTLTWPVQGDVIMNYSMDQTVYFATLNQYKYNPGIVIQADVGTQVKAPASAKVKEIGEDAKIGKYMILELGGSYELTIGQLQNISVKEGSSVSKDQTVAEVSEPSRYYSVEGSNVYMQLKKDGETVDPMLFLAQ